MVVSARLQLVRGEDGVERILETNRDITERRQAETKLRADLEALTAMHDLSTRPVEGVGMQLLLQDVMDAAVAIVDAQFGTLQLLEGDSLRIVAHHNHRQAFLDFFAAAENTASVCGEATRRGERVVVAEVESDPLFVGTPSLEVMRRAGVRAVQSTPLMTRGGDLLGILTTQWAAPHSPDEHDLWRIDLLARQASDLIEAARSEALLRESEEQYRTIVETAGEGVVLGSLDGVFLYVNQRMADMLGYEVDEIVGKATSVFISDDLHSTVREVRTGMSAAGTTASGELEFHRKDGSVFWSRYNATPWLDVDGLHVANLAMHTDITRIKEAEEALRESEERFRVVQEVSPDGFSILRPVRDAGGGVIDFEFVYQNAAITRIEGVDFSSQAGRRLLDLYPSHIGTPILDAYVRTAETGETTVLESSYQGEIEERTWFRLVVAPMGEDIAVLAQDITERMRAEEELREAEAKARDLVRYAPTGIYEIDFRGPSFRSVNDAMCDAHRLLARRAARHEPLRPAR